MASATPADSPRAAAAAAFAPSQQQHQPNTVGFQTKMVGIYSPAAAHAGISPERMAYLEATLAKLPELDLSEMARVKTCFAAVLGEGRENIVNGLELRVVLGDLGLYPSEEELTLVLRAYRDRVNLVGLARYLRLYKKEFWLNQVASRSHTRSRQPGNQQATATSQQQQQQIGAGGAGRMRAEGMSGMPNTYTAFSGSQARPAGGVAAGSGNDEDTLKAFVALGGEEDGSGEIAAATLRDAVRGFGLTLDIDAMIQTVDVHHSGMLDYVDFCTLWATPADGSGANGGGAGGVDSMGNALRQASADVERRASLGGSPFPMGGTNRRLLSALLTPSHRASLVAGAFQRRSQMMSLGNDTGASQPISPRLAAGNGNRPPTSERQGKDTIGAERVNGHNAVGVYAPVIAAAVPEPITEEEHELLVRMFLFPEQFDTVAASSTTLEPIGRRGNNNNNNTRFTLPSKNAQPLSPSKAAAAAMNGGNNPAPNGVLARRASVSQRAAANSTTASLQQQLSRPGKAGGAAGGRSGSQKRRGNKTSAGNRRGRKANSSNDDFGDEDDLAADFFSPKNQNVYRPPSPMLLSMRNSTAYRSHVKRLEGQKHAARGDAQQQRGLHAATVARDGGAGSYGYSGADGEGASRQTKSSTW